MIIKNIELNNFRIYYGLNTINLTIQEKNIIIVSGKNGYGKTTFLMSLVWCLYGKQMHEVDDLYKREISNQGGYSKYISNSLNRLAKIEGATKFSVSITFSDTSIPVAPCREIKITRSFDTMTSSNDEVEILIDGSANELIDDVESEHFIRDFILPKEIAKFFLFDAEKIVSLAEVNTVEQQKNLSKAYSEVLGIQKYEDLKKNLEDLQVRLRQDSASEKEKKQLNLLLADVQNLAIEKVKLEKEKEELNENKDSKMFESQQIQEKLIREGNLITVEELATLRKDESVLSAKLETLHNELKNSYDVIPLAIAGDKLFEVVVQLDDEKAFKNNQYKHEHITEITDKILDDLLIETKNCAEVIDHNVFEFYTKTFKKLIKKHFFSDVPEVADDFKVIHDFSESEGNELSTLVSNLRSSFYDAFKRIHGDYNQTKNELNSVRRKLKDAEANQEDPIIFEYRSQKESLDKEIYKIDEDVESITFKLGEISNEKIKNEKQINELTRKIKVSKENKAKDETSKRLIKELQAFIINYKEEKKHSLQQEILNGLNTLMHKKNFIKKVEVGIIGENIDIQLYNNRNEEIKKESLSKGEQQMYATALLMGLVEESEIEFPVFIDSPMQKFDEDHALNIVKYFYPKVSNQVVIFPLVNKELTHGEYEVLKPNIEKTFLINNIDNDKSEFVETGIDDFFNIYSKMNKYADKY